MADLGHILIIFDFLITQSVFGLDIKYDPSKFIIWPQDSFGTIRNEICWSYKFGHQGVRGSKLQFVLGCFWTFLAWDLAEGLKGPQKEAWRAPRRGPEAPRISSNIIVGEAQPCHIAVLIVWPGLIAWIHLIDISVFLRRLSTPSGRSILSR